ncbi:hypothetical protein EON64_04605 [archaeon]|nr:MAG: hypothetical protein EON64_04605 [archaeon]
MIPLPPTRLQLGTDSMLEVMNARKQWQEQNHLKAADQRPAKSAENINRERKRDVESRIGLGKPTK